MDEGFSQFVFSNVMAEPIVIAVVGSVVGSLFLQDSGVRFRAHCPMIP